MKATGGEKLIKKTMISATLVLGIAIYPSLSWSQQPAKQDFTVEQVQEANRMLDEFLTKFNRNKEYPWKPNKGLRESIIKEFLSEADSSPYFWKSLEVTEHRKTVPFNSKPFVTYSVMRLNWGTLILTSEPEDASVYIDTVSAQTKEGQTQIKRRYPEGTYTFILEKEGYKSEQVMVYISKKTPMELKVFLKTQ